MMCGTMATAEPIALARKIADQLAEIDGVVAVILGGSYARGEADNHSDIDIGLYYRHDDPIDTKALDKLAAKLDDRHAAGLATPIGEWGPWINGGAWLVVEDRGWASRCPNSAPGSSP